LLLPDAVSWSEAGGFAEAFTTAYDALVRQANLQPGERVAVSGAAGGVGVAAIQIARALGAHITAVTRDTHHHAELQRLGANECVTLDAVGDIEPVHVILELVGAAHLSVAQRRVMPRGRIVVIGVGGGGRVELDLLTLMSSRATITGSTLRARPRDEKASIAAEVQRNVVPWLADGTVSVPLHSTVALENAADAYEDFARPGKLGKIVLSTSSEHR
jgi:NADPH:quinone reductase-like Zn-dependent oxidoreductase